MSADRAPTAADVAGHYDEAYYRDLSDRYLRRSRFARRRIANVRSLLPDLAGRRVLDLGCGIGTFTVESARAGAVAVGVDPTPEAIRAARAVAGVERVAGAAFLRADAGRLPIRDGWADIVIAADLTEHLDDATLAAILAESRRALGAGGTLVLYTPSPSHVFERLRARGVLLRQDPSHIGLRDERSLARAVERAGFRIDRVLFLPSHLPGLDRVERATARFLPWLRRRIGLTAVKGAG